MPLIVNMRKLRVEDLRLTGELSVQDLELEGIDELVPTAGPLKYDLEVQELEGDVLAQGRLEIELQCECSRCLKRFAFPIKLTNWSCHLPLEGEDKVEVVNDSLDLTPFVREDIVLGFPQHPLCEPECGGLPKKAVGKTKNTGGASGTKDVSSAWAELNKLKF